MNGKLTYWLLGALLALVLALGTANLTLLLHQGSQRDARLDRMQQRMDRIIESQQDLDRRLSGWYGTLAERLARIESRLED